MFQIVLQRLRLQIPQAAGEKPEVLGTGVRQSQISCITSYHPQGVDEPAPEAIAVAQDRDILGWQDAAGF